MTGDLSLGPPKGARGQVARAADALAEATVIPSFSRVGFSLRRHLERWGEPPRMDGRMVVVTGATSGIGLAAARGLAALGADLHLVGRDPGRGAEAVAMVDAAGPGRVRLHLVDLSDLGSVADLGAQLAQRCGRLEALVHNAGSLSPTYATTDAGVERTVATQVLGPYVLTAALAPLLGHSAAARIVTVSSGGMYTQRFDLSALEMGPTDYDGTIAYARSKRAQLVLARAWADHLAPAGVASYSMHPGWVDTPGLAAGLPKFRTVWRPLLRTPAEGADTVVWLVAGGAIADAEACGRPGPVTGFFHDRHLRSDRRYPVSHPTGPGDEEALLAWCARRTGVDMPRFSGGA